MLGLPASQERRGVHCLVQCVYVLPEDLTSFVTHFEWDMAKYPAKQPLVSIADTLAKVREGPASLTIWGEATRRLHPSEARRAFPEAGGWVGPRPAQWPWVGSLPVWLPPALTGP